jgi:hypothetical protein
MRASRKTGWNLSFLLQRYRTSVAEILSNFDRFFL